MLPSVHCYLHSNMFLLIPNIASQNTAKSQENLHSNMFLLILRKAHVYIDQKTIFTFQYVSINTL